MGRRTDLDGLEAGPAPLGWTAGPSVLLVLLGGVTWPPTLIVSGRDERMQRIANERVEREVVPAVRSMNGLIATPTGRLVSQLKTPARFVIPGASSQVPDWLEARAAAEPGLVKVDSTPGIANPERSSELAVAAVRGDPLPAVTVNPDSYGARSARKDPISAKLGGLNARLLLRGLLQVLLGLPLLLWPGPLPTELVTATLVIWLGIEGTQTPGRGDRPEAPRSGLARLGSGRHGGNPLRRRPSGRQPLRHSSGGLDHPDRRRAAQNGLADRCDEGVANTRGDAGPWPWTDCSRWRSPSRC